MKYQYGFADESGETGHKFGQGSSTHFTAGLMLTNHPDALRIYLNEFCHGIGIGPPKGLGFYDSPDHNRIAFLKGLARYEWEMTALAVDKRRLPIHVLRLDKAEFYLRFFGDLLARTHQKLERAIVTLDEFGVPLETVRRLKRQLRGKLGGPVYRQAFHRIRYGVSHREPLLQIADMLTGAVHRFGGESDRRFYRFISDRTTLWLD